MTFSHAKIVPICVSNTEEYGTQNGQCLGGTKITTWGVSDELRSVLVGKRGSLP